MNTLHNPSTPSLLTKGSSIIFPDGSSEASNKKIVIPYNLNLIQRGIEAIGNGLGRLWE